jgi:hypothetical protein
MIGSWTEFQGTQLSTPLAPFVANSCTRLNFLVDGNKKFKITIDGGITYYSFVDGSTAFRIGEDKFARVEIKLFDSRLSVHLPALYSMLDAAGAELVISKKDSADNMYSAHLMRESRLQPKPTDTEIEAKLSIAPIQQRVFTSIKKDFTAGRVKGFAITEEFPYTLVSARINTYLRTNDNGYVRVSAEGSEKVVTTKEDSEMMADAYGLGCIVKRKELEKKPASSMHAHDGAALYKKAKNFMVRSKESGMDYNISIDSCFRISDKGSSSWASLSQVEIESTLSSPSKKQEADAVREIASITKQLMDMHHELAPTTVTKQEWLTGVSRK